MFTFYFYYYGQIILSGSLGCLVTPENLLQHLHSQILRRNMAQAINIIFIKLLLHISVKILEEFFILLYLDISEGDNLSGMTFFV